MITDEQFWSIIMLVFVLLFCTAVGIELESGIFTFFAGLAGIVLTFIVAEILGVGLVSGIVVAMSILLLLRGATDMLEPKGSASG